MAVKLRKISETAYMEPPAGGIRKPFNYAKAFVLVGVAVVAVVVVVVLLVNHLKGQVPTSDAWVEPSVEVNVKAMSDAVIEKLNVKFGQYVKKGDLLFTTRPAEGGEAYAIIREKEKVVAEVELYRDKAKNARDNAKRRLEMAEENWKERAITFDRYENARMRYDDAEIEYKAAEERVGQTRAKLDREKARYEVRDYRAEFNGRIAWLDVNEGDRVGSGDDILKIFDPASIEIIARMDENLARDVEEGQDVDIKVRTSSGVLDIKGKVKAVGNPFFRKDPEERWRLLIENPAVDTTKQVVRISIVDDEKGKEAKKVLFTGDRVSVTIDTR
jgi:multidrug resistance efflux pump